MILLQCEEHQRQIRLVWPFGRTVSPILTVLFWGVLQWFVNDPRDGASTPFVAELFQHQPRNLPLGKFPLEKGHESEKLLGKKGPGWTWWCVRNFPRTQIDLIAHFWVLERKIATNRVLRSFLHEENQPRLLCRGISGRSTWKVRRVWMSWSHLSQRDTRSCSKSGSDNMGQRDVSLVSQRQNNQWDWSMTNDKMIYGGVGHCPSASKLLAWAFI